MDFLDNEVFVTIKQEPEIYTLEELENQYGLHHMSFADLNKEIE